MRVNIGDFITIKYLDFNNQIKTGIFLVIYHECYDIPTSKSFVAVKVSSKPSGYQVPVYKEYLKFLNKNSFINCSSSHRFQEQQVLNIIGRASDYYLNRVITQLDSFQNRIKEQLTERLSMPRFTKSINYN